MHARIERSRRLNQIPAGTASATEQALTKFTETAIRQHIRNKHPGCPDFAVVFLAAEIAKKDWIDTSIGGAVGITMQNILRHLMTDYDQMLLCGVDRNEARRRVQPRIDAMLAHWAKPPLETKESPPV